MPLRPAGVVTRPQKRRSGSRWGSAALYDTELAHARRSPVAHAFTYRGYCWLVDLDDLPRPPWWLAPLARFRAADHFGRPDRSLRQNLDAYLGGQGVDLRGGRILMLANARVLGYVFNPLSVFWCHDAGGALACVVAEVHNTYGERHAYLLRVDRDGNARVAKEFYVSPFHPVDGEYRMHLPVPEEALGLRIELHREGSRPFVATLRGRRRDAGSAALVRTTVRYGWVTAAVALRIRVQGIRLWARGCPVVPRPPHVPPRRLQ